MMGMGVRVALVATLAALAASGATAANTAQTAQSRLVAFRGCPDLLDYARANASRFVGPYGFGGQVTPMTKAGAPGVLAPSAAAASSADHASTPTEGVDYSGTNVQENGVDEPDLVKTNGTTLFAFENGQLESVDVSSKAPKLLDTLKLDNTSWGSELLLSGTHLLVLSRGGYWIEPLPAMAARMIAPVASQAVLTEIDASDPSSLKVVKTLTLDGQYVDARMIGSTVRVVSSSQLPIALPFVTPTASLTADAATAANKNVVAHSRAKAWLPTYRLGKHGATHSLVQCRDILRPQGFSGLGMLTVTTIDLSKGLAPVDSTGVMTDGRIVYASPTSLYVATEPWSARPEPDMPNDAPQGATTQIHAFDISDPSRTTYLGSGTVPGYLLNQWSLSDFQGVLRVVSTDTPAWWGDGSGQSQSYLTTFRAGGGKLDQVGQIGGLGQGERVYAVRFIGNAGYVVTFKQVDPLHVIDLSDPTKPKVTGMLTLPGYSAYLHPISDGLLLGIGQDVGDNNEPTGTQISLFDVSDPAHPSRIAHASLGQGWSAAESDHHAFLYWPPTKLVMVPFGQQAVGMSVSKSGINELGRVIQTDARSSYLPQIDRALVVGDDVLTVSTAGVKSSTLSTLADVGWVPFPAVQPTPVPLPAGAATGVKKVVPTASAASK
jgi:uncharacterized secreted protein with C-terminal beta-propeller domain